MNYAGIGSRETPKHVLDMMSDIATLLAIDGHICNTGAALGADQAFANGANRVRGAIELALPWWNYEQAWVKTLHNANITIYDERIHIAATNSVKQFHPYYQKLKQGAFKLHARNYLIIEGCGFIICWTVDGKDTGGTGQGIRIAQSLGIRIYNLFDTETYNAFRERIGARSNEILTYSTF